jgi:hypothetical protein
MMARGVLKSASIDSYGRNLRARVDRAADRPHILANPLLRASGMQSSGHPEQHKSTQTRPMPQE